MKKLNAESRDFLTIAEAAEKFGVTRQRMHQLIKAYGVKTHALTKKTFVVLKPELKKIPKDRPNGVRIDCR